MQKFESAAHASLHSLCESEKLLDVLHPYAFIQGVVFAVAAAPEIPMPEKWLPWVIKTSNQLISTEQADEITDILMKLLQQQLKSMSEEKIHLPMDITFIQDGQKQSSVAVWCQGMLFGHSQLETTWQDAWSKMQVSEVIQMQQLQKDLSHCLYMFSTFWSSPTSGKTGWEKGEQSVAQYIATNLFVFPTNAKNLCRIIRKVGRLFT